jgi:hypothetical protein
MAEIMITAAGLQFEARLEMQAAPKTCAAFLKLLPYREQLIHVRWSGEACWIPLGDRDFDLPLENATSYPAPGAFIFYPGGFSETEMLLAYGGVRFASKLGQLAGSHFMTITNGQDSLAKLGHATLWKGAQDVVFERV